MKNSLYPQPEKLCKYGVKDNRECFNQDGSINKCATCSKNPHRFEGRTITKGQIIFLTSIGYDEKEISNWDYKRACREIQQIKA